jgi:acyl dehydratase
VERVILEDILVFASIIVGMGCLTGIVITYLKWRRPKPVAAGSELTGRLTEIAERLARLENSVDATAVEVERISEAQRFTAKVLAERTNAPKLPERKSVTPH